RDASALPYIQPDLVWYYMQTLTTRLTPGAPGGLPLPWDMLGGLLGWLLVLGCAVYLFTGRLFGRTVLLGSVIWTVFTLTLSFRTFGVHRFLVPVGGTFVVAGIAGLAWLWRFILSRHGVVFVGLRVLGTVLLLLGAVFAAIDVRDLESWCDEAVETTETDAELVQWIHEALPGPGNLMLVGAWDQVCEDGIRVDRLLRNPDARASDLDVRAIRRDRIYEGTGRLERWFDEESLWSPPGEKVRARYVMLLDTYDDHPPEDPENFPAIWAEAKKRLEGAKLLL
ncbi:MAG: hypothetical protein GY704_11345, partial [Phycisphaeraceae bacterium]|nr:hypothetical protein [Phycisphaeraceae bacterium]